MSPEQSVARTSTGDGPFFLRVVLYEMATGQLPFAAKRLPSIFEAILNRRRFQPSA